MEKMMKRRPMEEWRFGKIVLTAILLGISPTLMASDWWENVKINGDFRYRHEIIDKEDKDIQHRHRIRARISLNGKISDEARVEIGMSTGSTDPVSNNQTLSDAFSGKNLMINTAYFEMSPKMMPGLKMIGGKMENPFYFPGKSELIWDSDIHQEGLTLNYEKKSEMFSANFIASGLWIQERSSSDDSYLAGGQAIFTYNLPEKKGSLAFGGSYYSYGNAKGFPTFYELDDGKGNSINVIDDAAYYLTDFELVEAFGTFDFKTGNIPFTILGDFVTNTAADSLKNGWLVGIRIGKTKNPGSWAFRYNYRNVEKDAVVGIFTDSDFRGGGTDAKGHEIGGDYELMDKTTLAITYFNNKIGLEEDDQTDFERWQFDISFKF